MSDTTRPRAVLDSDIIFSRVLYELMGRMALDLRVLDLVWSDELLAEAKRALIGRKRLSEPAAQRWVQYLSVGFPNGRTDISNVSDSEPVTRLTADVGDRHVCALALAARASRLFTHDRGYLTAALRSHGIEVLRPDEFLVSQLQLEPAAVLTTLRLQARTWAGGRHTVEDLLDALARAGAGRFATLARGIV